MKRTQIPIGKAPPAGHETKNCLCPQLWNRHVHEDQVPARGEQIVQMPQHGAHIAHRVQHVGSDNEIKRSGLKACSVPGFSRSKILYSTSGKAWPASAWRR